MENYKVIVEQSDSTVVTAFESNKARQIEYQSERELENALIKQLVNQGYEYLNVQNTTGLLANLKTQIEKLNKYTFSEKEWNQMLDKYFINPNDGIVEKTRKVQEDYIFNLVKDNGATQNIKIIDKHNIHNNSLQVINQLEVEGKYKNIYDVTILVNGLPLVHLELKRRGVSIKEAFNQIRRYQDESFWAESGLYEYAQIFVISNGTETKYYSNTTREQASKENANIENKKKTSHSFEFTSSWADAQNKVIEDIVDFTETFFAKHALLNILTKYCVFTVDNLLLVMRPYQIVATERIVSKIHINLNDKKRIGKIEAGGHVWHTTGSGKTLTSFKTARIASELPEITKVLFVVDRKDLDYQTMKEYDKFEKGAANSNTSTAVLKKQLEDVNVKIIITTIQKLTIFVNKNKNHSIYDKNIVLMFDECHRSQFGQMHLDITKSFKKYMIFGFTGTPIMAVNANARNKFPTLKTTEQVFGERIHTYTIVDAITDGNVLPFRIDYIRTTKSKDEIQDEEVFDIKREEALLALPRLEQVSRYILEHFNQKTKRHEQSYDFRKLTNIKDVAKNQGKTIEQRANVKLTGFNSILATASIKAAQHYYTILKELQVQTIPDNRLKTAIIYSWNPNGDNDFAEDGIFDENNESTEGLDVSSREFLDNAIKDYNGYFGTNFDTSSDKFQNYYRDLSLRVKNREIDLLIVVNMFLTGFDATTLNTLWVDKPLRAHGLIQAFSRTNRILNSIKTFGNIVCFRNLEKEVNTAVALFGNKDANGIIILKSFDEYYLGYDDFEGYKPFVEKLQKEFPLGQPIVGEQNERNFIRLYNMILKTKNILQAFDDFKGKQLISDFDFQDYQSRYLSLYEKYRHKRGDGKDIKDDLVFELELVRSVEVNIDFILMLIAKYYEDHQVDKEITVKVSKALDASPTLRSKKDLIMKFIESVNVSDKGVIEEWRAYIEHAKEVELDKIIQDENLNPEETKKFVKEAFGSGAVKEVGVDIVKVLPPMSMFNTDREEKKKTVIQKITQFFERFFGL
jgi:type I restriction enzyme, R subunit